MQPKTLQLAFFPDVTTVSGIFPKRWRYVTPPRQCYSNRILVIGFQNTSFKATARKEKIDVQPVVQQIVVNIHHGAFESARLA